MKSSCIDHGQKGTKAGYGSTEWNKKATSAHRVAYMKAHSLDHADIKGQVVRHTCDNPRCINPDHLVIGTYKDNTADMHSRGRASNTGPKGMAHPKVLLTDAQVLEIRALWNAGGMYLKDIASRYGIAISTVRSAVRGENWKHLPLIEPCRIGKVGGKHTPVATQWNGGMP